MMNKANPGVGVDVGTMNFVSARQTGDEITTSRIRDAFIDLPLEHKRMLKLSNTSYVELDGKLLVIGDQALETANLFNREARRPMSAGIISAGEIDAQQVIAIMMKKILGEPVKKNEKCCYSVPAAALDVKGSDITYHTMVFKKILNELGYNPEPINEAQAIVFSEAGKEGFSGIGISYGAGMTNVCLCYNTMNALEFSVAKGGDWVDEYAARAVGKTKAKMTSLKESGINVSDPRDRDAEAIAFHIETLIDYSIKGIIEHFHKVKDELMVPKPIPIIVSGGTSLAGGFLNKFKERFEVHKSDFPIQTSEIRAAEDPMTAVSTGLLTVAQMDE